MGRRSLATSVTYLCPLQLNTLTTGWVEDNDSSSPPFPHNVNNNSLLLHSRNARNAAMQFKNKMNCTPITR